MTGLEKIKARIISDAENDASVIIANAEKECKRIEDENEEKIRVLRSKMNESAMREGEAIITRAKSSAEVEKRNLYLARKSELVDKVFENAYKDILSQTEEKYLTMLENMLVSVLVGCVKSEQESLEMYGEDTTSETYEVIFNKNDREKYGQKVISDVKASALDRIPERMISRLRLSSDIAAIDGGLILRCGDIETNCATEMIFASIRDELEGTVNKILFEERKK